MVKVQFVTIGQALSRLTNYGIYRTQQELEAQSHERVETSNGRVVAIIDYRSWAGALVDWVFSVEDGLGNEMSRFNVRR